MNSRYIGDMRQNHQTDIGETLAQRRRRTGVFKNPGPPPERRSTISSMMSTNFQMTRMRNLSGGSNGSTASGSSTGSTCQLDSPFSSENIMQLPLDFTKPNANSSSAVPQFQGDSTSSSHRKLDRSLSDSDSDHLGSGSLQSQRSVNSSRYKTELCRPFEESGSCKYGDKCQFAHGMHELRNLSRHPKYKTELCRTFHTIGFCPYGPRCHFVHGDDTKPEVTSKPSPRDKGPNGSVTGSGSSSPSLSPSGSDDQSYFHSRFDNNPPMNLENRPITNVLSVNINNLNNNTEDVQALEQQFSSVLSLNKHSNSAFHESGSHPWNSNCSSQTPGQQEVDIFSSVSFFNPNEVLDNASKQFSSSISFHKMSKVDNLPAQVDASLWHGCNDTFSERSIGSMDHYSPTGSTGSDSGNISDCSGSMESLASSEQLLTNQHFAVLQSLACSSPGGASVWS